MSGAAVVPFGAAVVPFGAAVVVFGAAVVPFGAAVRVRDTLSRSSALQEALASFEVVFGLAPPTGYLEFMRKGNGGEGQVRNGYLMLWPLEELQRQNAAYNVTTFAPGLVLFGSSGGGEAYGFDTRRRPHVRIVSGPFIGMRLEAARDCGGDFDSFLEVIARGEE
jgi:hypothetical protein